MRASRFLLLASLPLAACGKSDSAKPAPPVAIDLAAVNALVPANLKDKLVFEQRVVEEERGRKSKTSYTLAGPKRWEPGDMKMFAKLRPVSEDGFGNLTEISLGSNCDGQCEPKDWAKVSDKVNFAQFKTHKIIKDEPGKTSHLMTSQNDTTTYVMYAWWRDGSSSYNTCMVTLDKGFRDDVPDIQAAAPAFEKACQAVNVATSGD